MRRIGKGFSGVDTPLFDGMLVQPQVQAVEDAVEDEDDNHEQVENLEQDKIVQAIEITKLKQRVKRLEKKRQFKSSGLKRLRKVGTAQRVESSTDTVLDDQEDASRQGGIVELDADEDVTLEEVDAEVTMDAAVVTTTTTSITAAQVPKASAPRRRRGVIIQDPEEAATASVIMHSEDKSKDKGKGKKKHDDISQEHGWIQDFKRMTYTDIRPIFEKHYNLNQAFLERVEEQVIGQNEEERSKRKGEDLKQDAAKKQRIDEDVEELKTHLQIVANDDDDVYTEATPLASKVPVVDYQIHHEHNKPYYKIIRADETNQLFLNFITLLKNFDIEDLEMLWKLHVERSKRQIWVRKSQELEAIQILWSSHLNTYNYSDDSASRKEIPFDKTSASTYSSFTPEQMQKLLSLINGSPSSSTHANMASWASIFNGANHHLTMSTIGMFNFVDITSLTITICHPNGTLATVSHVGNLRLTSNVIVCYIHDFKNEKILGTGSESSGLYLFDMIKDNSVGKSNMVMCFNVSKTRPMGIEDCASWDLDNSTWGGWGEVIGTVQDRRCKFGTWAEMALRVY
nr:ribonuclease H-like domain-containing protein [Tanacetum cinerariifolium]